jgi:hypothetical protein
LLFEIDGLVTISIYKRCTGHTEDQFFEHRHHWVVELVGAGWFGTSAQKAAIPTAIEMPHPSIERTVASLVAYPGVLPATPVGSSSAISSAKREQTSSELRMILFMCILGFKDGPFDSEFERALHCELD